ncbi:hypothetical protein UY3_12411 [Chelonia mydas]|uniref:Uncharacterized protein n=1 Tax=Chelonia mydas TaxID=8469 RepID=M7B4H9_CHEMY|nr:hypothetical protein UY3_12411 [Chelonia mydas]
MRMDSYQCTDYKIKDFRGSEFLPLEDSEGAQGPPIPYRYFPQKTTDIMAVPPTAEKPLTGFPQYGALYSTHQIRPAGPIGDSGPSTPP